MGGCRATGTMAGARAALAVWLAALAPMAAEAATRAAPQEEQDTTLQCLPARAALRDDGAYLRLAGAPLTSGGGTGPLQAYSYRLFGPGAAASAAASPESLQNPLADMMFKPPPPLVRLLVDGSVDLLASRHGAAEQRLSECEKTASAQNELLIRAACAGNRALLHAAQGKLGQARTELEQVLRLYESKPEPPADLPVPPMLSAMAGLGGGAGPLAALLGRMPPEQRAQVEAQMKAQQETVKARLKEAAVTVWHKQAANDVRQGTERTLLNLGNLETAAGRLGEAEKLFKRAFDSHAAGEPAACRSAAAADLARLHRRLGHGAESNRWQSLVVARQTRPKGQGDDSEDPGVLELGVLHLATGADGTVVARAEAPPAAARAPAEPPTQPAGEQVMRFGESSGRFDDGALTRLQAEAARAEGPNATGLWQRLALRAAAARRPDLEFRSHAALMRASTARGEAALAVFHGKRAANLAQQTRAALEDRSPSREARRAFLRERRQVYLGLAQALLDQQRLAEAESVLQILKEDEGQQFAEGGAASAPGNLPLNAPEQALLRQDEEAAGRLRRTEEARVGAVAKMPLGAGGLSMLDRKSIEAQRLRFGLGLGGLGDLVKRKPLTLPLSDERVRTMTLDVQDFFIGPGRRAEKYLAHLVEDAPRFENPPEARVRAQLADLQARLPRILAEAAPLLRNLPPEEGNGLRITTRRPGAPREDDGAVTDVRHYAAAEVMEGFWRSLHEGDEVETRHLADRSRVSLASAPPAGPSRDDSLSLLATLPSATALLYYLPGEDRLDALLVSAGGRRHVRLAVPRAELNAAIDDFAAVLREPDRDPLPAAQALYRRLFAPLESAVSASGARVLALALADRLRFVPFAALHDGRGWLVERYAIALHPGGRLAGRLKPASPQWRAAAFGATLGGAGFPPLPSVRGEIAAVVRQREGPGGALPGEAFLDQGFTAERLRSALAGGAQVLHIASHFKFSAGDAAGSYLLLGDGGRLSLKELAGPQYRFDRTELVTLSACATGVSADDTYGQEVDGLAALLMGQGAPSVLASLWEVNDQSTAALMSSLYRLREGQHLSRALALQQAQLAMIRAAMPAGGGESRGVARVRLPGDPDPEPAAPASALPGQAHPFHWGAFVLMGNWL